MCGICGYVNLDGKKEASEGIVKAMSLVLASRGPDDEGYFAKGGVAMGHRRLSIIDLATGHQPLSNQNRSKTIVYNGEIYNFREIRDSISKKGRIFLTNSDTEVLLAAYEVYGEDCLKLLNGMYAFAIWNEEDKSMFLARDRFGKKPLYYAVFEGQFIFASELKAILKHPSVKREIDPAALKKYFAYEYVPSPLTIFKGIYKLRPGEKMLVKNGSYRAEKYYDAPISESPIFDKREAEEKLSGLFMESVKKRLVSDVPLGVFLSGGVDSSSIVAMMAELMPSKSIKTFSIAFKDKLFDESADARIVADFFGTDHNEEIMDVDAMLDIFPRVLDTLDEPFADSSIIPTYLVSRFTRKSVKVALGGDGGDELFMGYPSFRAYQMDGYIRFLPDQIKKALLGFAASVLPHSREKGNLFSYMRRFAGGYGVPESVRHQAWIGAFTPKMEKELFLPGQDRDFDPLEIYGPTANLFDRARSSDPLTRAMYIYINTYMADDILSKVDRASMANSLEVRAPFLDKDFAEFAMSIPASLKLRNGESKWILKRAMREKLPADTLNKPKRGFAVPVAKWLKDDLKHMLLEALKKEKIEREGLFEYSYIDRLLKSFFRGNRDVSKEIWAIFIFEMWYDRWMR